MRKADNLPPTCAVVTKYGSLNFLESSGPVQACNGTALPLPLHANSRDILKHLRLVISLSNNLTGKKTRDRDVGNLVVVGLSVSNNAHCTGSIETLAFNKIGRYEHYFCYVFISAGTLYPPSRLYLVTCLTYCGIYQRKAN